MRLIFLGPPGAGKGTQALILTRRTGVPKVSTGDMLRDAAEHGSPLGMRAREYCDRGLLVPDDVVVDLVAERLAQTDAQQGFLLDGFPRTVAQAESLDHLLREQGQRLDAVINFLVNDEEIVSRISSRRVCSQCGESYHTETRPPKIENTCDQCGAQLVLRDDDRQEVVRARLQVYHDRTEPLIGYYRSRGLLVDLDATQPVDDVAAQIEGMVRAEAGGSSVHG